MPVSKLVTFMEFRWALRAASESQVQLMFWFDGLPCCFDLLSCRMSFCVVQSISYEASIGAVKQEALKQVGTVLLQISYSKLKYHAGDGDGLPRQDVLDNLHWACEL